MPPRAPTPPSNVEVVTYALARLGGVDQPAHLEEIASEAFKLTPGAFRWDLDRFATAIDKDKVRVSLTDAEKPDRGYVEAVGTSKGGSKRTDYWRLTAVGVTWVSANEDRLAAALGGPSPKLRRIDARRISDRIESNGLYPPFRDRGVIEPNDYLFADLLECSPDAPHGVIARRFDELKAQVALLENKTYLRFITACGVAHADMLGARK